MGGRLRKYKNIGLERIDKLEQSSESEEIIDGLEDNSHYLVVFLEK